MCVGEATNSQDAKHFVSPLGIIYSSSTATFAPWVRKSVLSYEQSSAEFLRRLSRRHAKPLISNGETVFFL